MLKKIVLRSPSSPFHSSASLQKLVHIPSHEEITGED